MAKYSLSLVSLSEKVFIINLDPYKTLIFLYCLVNNSKKQFLYYFLSPNNNSIKPLTCISFQKH